MYGRHVELKLPLGVTVEMFVYCIPGTSEKRIKEMAITKLMKSLSQYDAEGTK